MRELEYAFMRGRRVVTVHHLACLARKRVSDIRWILDCVGIGVDPYYGTVAIVDVLNAWGPSVPDPLELEDTTAATSSSTGGPPPAQPLRSVSPRQPRHRARP